MSESGPSPKKKNNKRGDTRLVQAYLTCALCLWLGDGSAVPVHDRFLGSRGDSIAVDVSDGSGGDEGPSGREGEPRAETTFRS